MSLSEGARALLVICSKYGACGHYVSARVELEREGYMTENGDVTPAGRDYLNREVYPCPYCGKPIPAYRDNEGVVVAEGTLRSTDLETILCEYVIKGEQDGEDLLLSLLGERVQVIVRPI